MFCNKCGKELINGASFCIGCGTRVAQPSDSGSPFAGIPANTNENRTQDFVSAQATPLSSAVYNLNSSEYAMAIQNRYSKPVFLLAFFSLLIPFLGLMMYFVANRVTKAAQVYYICFKINIAFWIGIVALWLGLLLFGNLVMAFPL